MMRMLMLTIMMMVLVAGMLVGAIMMRRSRRMRPMGRGMANE
jgi:preprotein translocase subunit SecG